MACYEEYVVFLETLGMKPEDPTIDMDWAIEKGYLPVIRYLVEHGADIHTPGNRALRTAAENGHLLIVQYLVERGAVVNGAVYQYSPLIYGAQYGHLPIVKYLVEHGADAHANDSAALRYSAQNGHLPVVQYLIEHGVDIHVREDEALRESARNGHFPIVQYLVQQGANIHARNDEAMLYGARHGLSIVQCLVEAGANVRIWNDFMAVLCARTSHIDLLEYLVSKGVDVCAWDNSAVTESIAEGNMTMACKLLELGAQMRAPVELPKNKGFR